MEKLKVLIIVVMLAAIITGGIFFYLRQNSTSYPIEIILPPPSQEIEIYVSGEVQNSGMHVLKEGARVADAIEAAGGFTAEADSDYINQARILRDGDQVHIPQAGQSVQLININTAEAWLLEALAGIGETLAGRIVEYRKEFGLFESIDDIKNVQGVRDSTFTKLKDKITVR